MPDALSAITTVGALVLPMVIRGMTQASATRRRSIPHGTAPSPMRQAPQTWNSVVAVSRMKASMPSPLTTSSPGNSSGPRRSSKAGCAGFQVAQWFRISATPALALCPLVDRRCPRHRRHSRPPRCPSGGARNGGTAGGDRLCGTRRIKRNRFALAQRPQVFDPSAPLRAPDVPTLVNRVSAHELSCGCIICK